jgi:hypothetical protein
MVQAVINVDEHVNRVLNIVKAKYGLKDKSQAIEVVVTEYERKFLEPELRPEYAEKIRKIRAEGNYSHYKSIKDLRSEIENA